MTRKRKDMRQIKKLLQLRYEQGLSDRVIARICGIGKTTCQDYFKRYEDENIGYPLPDNITEEELEELLFSHKPGVRPRKNTLDFAWYVTEMRRPNVTLQRLWEEYNQAHPEGYQYSYFCQLYREYVKKLNYSMRQEHKAGDKCFVDFCDGLSYYSKETGETVWTQLFVSVWGASCYTYARATRGEDLNSWIDANIGALHYFGCSPHAIVPDNLKSAVLKTCRYEPEIHPTFLEFSEHYGTAIIPARPRKPKDKAKVENGVRIAQRWILAALRDRTFYSIGEINEAIAELLVKLNSKPMVKLKKSRREMFELLDQPNALPLSGQIFEISEWKKVRVNINYHIEFDQHYYSVPYTFIGQELEVKASSRLIEIIRKGERICSHQRQYRPHEYTTVAHHMPKAHQKHLEWTPERILNWASQTGEYIHQLVKMIMDNRPHPEQAYKSSIGIIQLAKRHDPQRVNLACKRALEYRNYSYRCVKNILAKGLEKCLDGPISGPSAGPVESEKSSLPEHRNIRGADYYARTLGRATYAQTNHFNQDDPLTIFALDNVACDVMTSFD